ncbi:PA3496 family putative envelope integrity protein [Amphritea japonica]|uniref:PA3496 family putative envelope integrity protein n=1 Tax=Amphritea japonica TaxID=452627 RepID=UPI0003630329|nr:hypothetical protein [Amphritea japonica]
MSSKIRLDDLIINDLSDIDSDHFLGPESKRKKRNNRKKPNRQMIEDYIEERSLKRRITESYDML